MNGNVDEYGRSLVNVVLSNPLTSATARMDAWVDTGFTGELILPIETIAALRLERSPSLTVLAELGDGTTTDLDTHIGAIDWFGTRQTVEVIAKNGRFPLLGVALLHDKTLHIDYEKRTMSID